MKDKLGTAYKTIGEVAKDLNLINPKNGKLNTHTIRFWEKEFKQLKPKILTGNRRYYSKKDIRKIEILARNNDADLIVTTEKDWVKTQEHDPGFDVAVVSILMEPIEKNKFNRLLKSFSI